MELIRKALLLTVVVGASVAYGVPITYTYTSTATGTIGGTPFTNATLTLSVTLDTGNVTNPGGFFQNLYGANIATFSISGVGSGTLSSTGAIFLNQNSFGGIVTMFDNGIHDTIIEVDGNSIGSIALASYALTTAIGPLGPQGFNGSPTVATSRGNLTVTHWANVTFQATTSGPPAVPIPPSVYLCIAGLAVISAYAAARRRARFRML